MKSLIISLTGIFLLVFASASQANKVKKMDIDAPDGYSKAPLIKVYSTDGEKWDRIDKTASTMIEVKLNAECKYEGKGNKAYRGSMTVPGYTAQGDPAPANFLIPHADSAEGLFRYNTGEGQSIDPIAACKNELQKRLSEQPDKTKYHLLSRGFTLNYPAAITVNYYLTCKPTGWGFTATDSDSTKVNAKIECQKSALAEEKIPKPAPKPKRVKIAAPLKTATFVVVPAEYTGKCPVSVEFKETITANYRVNVRYRYVSHDGRESPEFVLEFEKAGTLPTRKWLRTVSKPDTSKSLSMGGKPSQWDVQGWQKLEILSPKEGTITAKYKVDCQQSEPERAIIKMKQ